MSIIGLEKARQMITDGIARCDGRTLFDQFGKAHLIVTSAKHVDHVEIDDSMDVTGCSGCGQIVSSGHVCEDAGQQIKTKDVADELHARVHREVDIPIEKVLQIEKIIREVLESQSCGVPAVEA